MRRAPRSGRRLYFVTSRGSAARPDGPPFVRKQVRTLRLTPKRCRNPPRALDREHPTAASPPWRAGRRNGGGLARLLGRQRADGLDPADADEREADRDSEQLSGLGDERGHLNRLRRAGEPWHVQSDEQHPREDLSR